MPNRLKDAELFLLDMDGTIYLGNQAIDGAAKTISKLKSLNKKYAILPTTAQKARGNIFINFAAWVLTPR